MATEAKCAVCGKGGRKRSSGRILCKDCWKAACGYGWPEYYRHDDAADPDHEGPSDWADYMEYVREWRDD